MRRGNSKSPGETTTKTEENPFYDSIGSFASTHILITHEPEPISRCFFPFHSLRSTCGAQYRHAMNINIRGDVHMQAETEFLNRKRVWGEEEAVDDLLSLPSYHSSKVPHEFDDSSRRLNQQTCQHSPALNQITQKGAEISPLLLFGNFLIHQHEQSDEKN